MERVVKKRTTSKQRKYVICTILLLFFISSIVAILFLAKPETPLEEKNNIKEITDNQEEQIIEDEKEVILEEPSIEQTPQEENKTEQKEETQVEETKKEPSKEENKTNSNTNNSTNNKNNNSSTNTDIETVPSITPDQEQEEPQIEIEVVNDKTINLNNYSSSIKITEPGEYTLTGKLNYSIYIETTNDITLNLNGVSITSNTDSAIANINDNLLTINLKNGTINKIADASGIESKYDGCLFSNGPIIIEGTGTLNVFGNQIDGEGIATKNSPITINNGNINVYSVDDGLNTGGTGGTIMINDGNVYIEAGGDGIDSNRGIVFNGGTNFIVGGSKLINGGLDADEEIQINGGTIIALGSDQLQVPNIANQNVLNLDLKKVIKKGTLVTILDENDNVIISFESTDDFQNMTISSSDITSKYFSIYTGGTNTGTKINGIYSNGTYTKGTLINIQGRTNFEIYDTITTY